MLKRFSAAWWMLCISITEYQYRMHFSLRPTLPLAMHTPPPPPHRHAGPSTYTCAGARRPGPARSPSRAQMLSPQQSTRTARPLSSTHSHTCECRRHKPTGHRLPHCRPHTPALLEAHWLGLARFPSRAQMLSPQQNTRTTRPRSNTHSHTHVNTAITTSQDINYHFTVHIHLHWKPTGLDWHASPAVP